VGRGVVQ
jgi:hypothetical protein